jgi:hypothetical protein
VTFLSYLLLFVLGFVTVAFSFWLATNVATDIVGRVGRRRGWGPVPDHEMGLAFLAPLVVFVAFLLAFLIVCLNPDRSFGTVFAEAFGSFVLPAVISVGWSKASAWLWIAQMLVPGAAFAVLAWLIVGN